MDNEFAALEPYSDLYNTSAQQYSLDPDLLRAQAWIESRGKPNAVGPETPYGRAEGPAQLIPATAASLGVTDPYDPKQAIPGQAKLMAENVDRYGDAATALLAYHGGTDQKNWGPKTRKYQKDVLDTYHKMKAGNSTVMAQNDTVNQDAPIDIESALEARAAQGHGATATSQANAPVDIEAALEARASQGQTTGKGSSSQTMKPLPGESGGDYVKRLATAALSPDSPTSLENTLLRKTEDLGASISAPPGSGPIRTALEPAARMAAIVPTLGLGEGLAGAAGLLAKSSPRIASALRFVGGEVPSNAEVNEAGNIIKKATAGNKLTRLASTVPINAAQGGLLDAEYGGDNPTRAAELGAVVGPAGYLIGKAGGAAFNMYNKAKNYADEYATPAMNKIIEAVRGDKISDLGGSLSAAGANASIADLGPNSRGLFAGSVNAAGTDKEPAVQFLEGRQAGQGKRIFGALREGTGVAPEETADTVIQGIKDTQKKETGPYYKAAYDANKSMVSPELNRILETPSGSKAVKDAINIMRDSRKEVGMSDPELVEQAKLVDAYTPGSGGIAPGLNMETLDYTKKALDKMYERTQTLQNPRGDTHILDVKNDLLAELEKLDTTTKEGVDKSGQYAQGRATFAKHAKQIDAVNAGRDYLKSTPAQNEKIISGLDEEGKKNYRIGAAEVIQNTIDRVPDGGNVVRKILNNEYQRKNLQKIMSPEQFNKFQKLIDQESEQFDTYAYSHPYINTRTTPLAEDVKNATTQKGPISQTTQKAVEHSVNMLQRNTTGKALYAGNLAWNKLLSGDKLTPEDSNLVIKMMLPENQADTIANYNKLTGPKAFEKGKDYMPKGSLLSNYMQALGKMSGITP